MPSGLFAGDGERMERGGGNGGPRPGRSEADRTGSDEDGDRGGRAERRCRGSFELCSRGTGVGGAAAGDVAKRGVMKLDLESLRQLYKSGTATPSDVIAAIYDRIAAAPLHPVWISVAPREKAIARARKLERDPLSPARPLLSPARPLYGVPFAIK